MNFEKEYNSMYWGFLFYMMGRLGFNSIWIKWIKACLESTIILVLVNGSPTDEFRPRKGLRQRDPLPSFLFLITAKDLMGLVRKAKRKNVYEGVEVGTRGI